MSISIQNSCGLPRDVWLTIFSQLDTESLAPVMRVCKLWNALAQSPAIWKSLYLRDYSDVNPEDDQNWKANYKKARHYLLPLIESNIQQNNIQSTDLKGVYPLYLSRGKLFSSKTSYTKEFHSFEQIQCADAMTGALLQAFKIQSNPNVVCVGGDRLFYSSYEKTIHVWNIKTGEHLPELEMPGLFNVTALCASSDMLFGGTHHKIHVWKISTGQYLRELDGHIPEATALCVSEGHLFSAGTYEKTIKVWNASTGDLIRLLVHDEKGGVDSLCASSDKLFSGGSYDCTVRIWSIKTGDQIQALGGHTANITVMRLWAGFLFSGSEDNTVRIWKAETGAHLQTIQTYPEDFRWRGGEIRSLCAGNGKLYSGHKNGEAFCWDFSAKPKTGSNA